MPLQHVFAGHLHPVIFTRTVLAAGPDEAPALLPQAETCNKLINPTRAADLQVAAV
jgi:hypothetical protein